MTEASGVMLGGLDRNIDKLSTVRNLMFAACGTSLYASQYGAKLMRDMGAVDTCNAHVSSSIEVAERCSGPPFLINFVFCVPEWQLRQSNGIAMFTRGTILWRKKYLFPACSGKLPRRGTLRELALTRGRK